MCAKVLSLSIDFYVRVFVRVYTSPQTVKDSPTKLAYLFQSRGCDSFHLQSVGRKVSTGCCWRLHTPGSRSQSPLGSRMQCASRSCSPCEPARVEGQRGIAWPCRLGRRWKPALPVPRAARRGGAWGLGLEQKLALPRRGHAPILGLYTWDPSLGRGTGCTCELLVSRPLRHSCITWGRCKVSCAECRLRVLSDNASIQRRRRQPFLSVELSIMPCSSCLSPELLQSKAKGLPCPAPSVDGVRCGVGQGKMLD